MHHSDAASNERRVQGTVRVILASKPQDTFSSKLGGLRLRGGKYFFKCNSPISRLSFPKLATFPKENGNSKWLQGLTARPMTWWTFLGTQPPWESCWKNSSGQILISWQTNSCSISVFQSEKLWLGLITFCGNCNCVRVCARVCVCVCVCVETGGLCGVWFLVSVQGGLSLGFEQKCPSAAFWPLWQSQPSAQSSQRSFTHPVCP